MTPPSSRQRQIGGSACRFAVGVRKGHDVPVDRKAGDFAGCRVEILESVRNKRDAVRRAPHFRLAERDRFGRTALNQRLEFVAATGGCRQRCQFLERSDPLRGFRGGADPLIENIAQSRFHFRQVGFCQQRHHFRVCRRNVFVERGEQRPDFQIIRGGQQRFALRLVWRPVGDFQAADQSLLDFAPDIGRQIQSGRRRGGHDAAHLNLRRLRGAVKRQPVDFAAQTVRLFAVHQSRQRMIGPVHFQSRRFVKVGIAEQQQMKRAVMGDRRDLRLRFCGQNQINRPLSD